MDEVTRRSLLQGTGAAVAAIGLVQEAQARTEAFGPGDPWRELTDIEYEDLAASIQRILAPADEAHALRHVPGLPIPLEECGQPGLQGGQPLGAAHPLG